MTAGIAILSGHGQDHARQTATSTAPESSEARQRD
jgi:hypothetical protein